MTTSQTLDSSEFLHNLEGAFDNQAEGLQETTALRSLKAWDSIASVSIVAMIYAEYDVQVSGEELISCETASDLLQMVQSKVHATNS